MWKSYEPRLHIPVLKGYDTIIDIACYEAFNKKRTVRDLAKIFYYYFKKIKSFSETCALFKSWLLMSPTRYRCILFDSNHESQGTVDLKDYQMRDSLIFEVKKVFPKVIFDRDYSLVLVASRGRIDRWSSSAGNISVKYFNQDHLFGYRTGFFARNLNHAKGHFGFTGINPSVLITSDLGSKLLFMNHSSNPDYDVTIEPQITLKNVNNETLTRSFGKIPPHFFRTMDVEDIFPEAQEFLKAGQGSGVTITELKGYSVASYHFNYNKKTGSYAVDHSRPSHANVIDYMR